MFKRLPVSLALLTLRPVVIDVAPGCSYNFHSRSCKFDRCLLSRARACRDEVGQLGASSCLCVWSSLRLRPTWPLFLLFWTYISNIEYIDLAYIIWVYNVYKLIVTAGFERSSLQIFFFFHLIKLFWTSKSSSSTNPRLELYFWTLTPYDRVHFMEILVSLYICSLLLNISSTYLDVRPIYLPCIW